jgi:hypothetical protein
MVAFREATDRRVALVRNLRQQEPELQSQLVAHRYAVRMDGLIAAPCAPTPNGTFATST